MEFMQIIELLSNDNISIDIRLDVTKRIIDYCEAGGKETDPYIKKELMYLEEVKENAKQNR